MLYHWLVQASLLIVKIQTDLDDQVDPIIEKENLGKNYHLLTFTLPKRSLVRTMTSVRVTGKQRRSKYNFCLQVILDEHCDFLTRILKLVLSPKMRHLETDFTIDLRNFKNFQLKDQNLEEEEEEHLEEQGIKVIEIFIIMIITSIIITKVTEELLSSQGKIGEISKTFADFLSAAENLETFVPGLFITDRSQTAGGGDPHTLSLCFGSPQVPIMKSLPV